MNQYILNVINRLRAGEHVVHSEGGNSMAPVIGHREPVLLAPITDENALENNHIVFCKVNSFFTHKIKSIQTMKGKRRYQISNLKGHVNGVISIDKIYGKVVAIGRDKIDAYLTKIGQKK
ncbi:MAG: hypothetical protein US50_C0012G0005 [Candidatus Nomurabacteria bacterium GW2011_GWB1_37_5]|uniref:Peptidase S24/S26A/S26B/S26C domain-containing protein n=1 Tax=Candidatus Nomurabacteria bacterium GW2011_GWB1_37_5 TaxID=1618742 RepID=A0A0G0HAG8_9BACT|nr:MAG: hypothetical protein US50_C0012G0005 [Candidatus Nomurabacteria bacterium GW2011_GWB1_37_5]